MNQKKAKRLKLEAMSETIGMPFVKYDNGESPRYAKNPETQSIMKVMHGVPTVLNKNCTRYVYKQKKLEAA